MLRHRWLSRLDLVVLVVCFRAFSATAMFAGFAFHALVLVIAAALGGMAVIHLKGAVRGVAARISRAADAAVAWGAMS